jgi:hypothetical protein
MNAKSRIGTAWAMAPAIAPLTTLAACAHQPAPHGDAAGFFSGLFQGFTALLAVVGSLFLPVRPYAFPNDGFWYDAGFCLGFSTSIIVLVVCLIARVGGFITRGH